MQAECRTPRLAFGAARGTAKVTARARLGKRDFKGNREVPAEPTADEPVTLVLLPGLDGTELFFGPLRDALPVWVRTVVVTYPTSGPNGYDDLLPRVERAVEAAGDCFVLGWSFAGPLALKAAVAQSSCVRGVILCASFVRAPRPWLAPLRRVLTPSVMFLLRALKRSRYVLRGYPSEALRHAKAETWRRVSPRMLAVRARAVLTVDARTELAACKAPVLCLTATRDEVIPDSKRAEILATCPAVMTAEIAGPHLALFTNPHAAAAAIVAFVHTSRAGH
jgi:pimeloyl-ACP methyl ester carboxylesterase